MAKLLLMADGFMNREFELKPGVNTIGRGPANDIQIPSGSISTHHCEVTFNPAESTVFLRDLGSTNGTFVGGQRVREIQVAEGQAIRLGDIELQCQTGSTPPKPRIAAPLPPPIPTAGKPIDAAQPSALLEGQQACKNHPQVAATMICKKCGHTFCNSCVKIQHIAVRTVRFCSFCGDECITLAQHFASKNVVVKTFYERLPGAFAFPFKGDGLMILIAGTIFFLVLGFVQSHAFLLSILFTVVGIGYVFGFMQEILVASGMGDEKPPGYPDVTNFYADLFLPFLHLVGTLLFCFGPALIYLGMSDEGAPFRWVILSSFVVAGGLYLPMAILAVGMHGTFYALNPLLIAISISRVPMEYFVACILLGFVFTFHLLFKAFVLIPVLGPLISGFLSLYFLMVEMRILGLLFHSKRRELGWKVC